MKTEKTKQKWSELIRECEEHNVKFVTKKGAFWSFIGFMAMFIGNRTFNTKFATCFGNYFCFPEGWLLLREETAKGCSLIAHELHHIKQQEKIGLGFIWLGFFIMMFLYALIPLPFGFAYCRWLFERKAYVVGHKVYMELANQTKLDENTLKWFKKQMLRGNYFFAMSFAPCLVDRYYRKEFK